MELFAADGHDAGGCERVTGKSGMRPDALRIRQPHGDRGVGKAFAGHEAVRSTRKRPTGYPYPRRRAQAAKPGRSSCHLREALPGRATKGPGAGAARRHVRTKADAARRRQKRVAATAPGTGRRRTATRAAKTGTRTLTAEQARAQRGRPATAGTNRTQERAHAVRQAGRDRSGSNRRQSLARNSPKPTTPPARGASKTGGPSRRSRATRPAGAGIDPECPCGNLAQGCDTKNGNRTDGGSPKADRTPRSWPQ